MKKKIVSISLAAALAVTTITASGMSVFASEATTAPTTATTSTVSTTSTTFNKKEAAKEFIKKFLNQKIPQEIELKSKVVSIKVGETTQLKVNGFGNVVFVSLDNSIVKVDKNGNITGINEGSVKVQVEVSGDDKHYGAKVYVSVIVSGKNSTTTTTTVAPTSTTTTTTVAPTSTTTTTTVAPTSTTTTTTVAPTSTTTKPASVPSTPLKPPCFDMDKFISSILTKKESQKVVLKQKTLSVVEGKNAQILASGYGKLTYISLNKDVATVDANGKVTGVANGTAKIIVTAVGDSKHYPAVDYVTVNVSAASKEENQIKVITPVLKVRSGAGQYPVPFIYVLYPVVDTVYAGEVYNYTETKVVNDDVWYKITLSETESGWVYGPLVEKLG